VTRVAFVEKFMPFAFAGDLNVVFEFVKLTSLLCCTPEEVGFMPFSKEPYCISANLQAIYMCGGSVEAVLRQCSGQPQLTSNTSFQHENTWKGLPA
jgi:hypothetical protein